MKIVPMTLENHIVPMTSTPMDFSVEEKEMIKKNEIFRK